MTTNSEPDPEQGLAVPSSTPETTTPPQPTLDDVKILGLDAPAIPSNDATRAPITEFEQPSVSSTPATHASSACDQQNNDGDDEQEESSIGNKDVDDDDDDNDMYEGDVIIPVELTVVPHDILEAIPDEIWCLLLSFVPPAKLTTLTRVCRRWKLMIERDLIASYWKSLTIQGELLDHSLSLDLDVDSEHAEMPIGLVKTYLELVLGHTLVICELCLMRSKRGCGSAIPLPVDRQDTLGRVWMCRLCRRDYYERYPEPERSFKAEDQISLYGLPSHPLKLTRSTGPPAPRRYYYPRRHRGGRSSGYYDNYDSSDYDLFDESNSTDNDWDSDELDELYYATEADLEADDRWTREADAREAAAEEGARVLKGVIQGTGLTADRDTLGDNSKQGQGVQGSDGTKHGQGNESSGTLVDDKLTSVVEREIDDAVITESNLAGQSSDAGGTSLDDGYHADGEPEIRLVIDDVEGGQADQGGEVDGTTMDDGPASNGEAENTNVEPENEEEMDEEDGKGLEDDDEMEEEDEIDEEDERMSYNDSNCSNDDDEDEVAEEPQTPANQSIVQDARRHHGGDIGIQAHISSNVQLQTKLNPLRNRLMETRLSLLGLQRRGDSKLCQDYLNGLMDDPFKIADVMKQMQWYFSATAYSSYIKDNDSSTAKSAAMEQWIEDLIADHGENAKNAYRGLEEDEDPGDAVANVMDAEQPPKSLWGVLDKWIEHRLKDDQGYSPALDTFAVRVATDDLED